MQYQDPGLLYHLISSCWFVSYRIPSCFNVIRLPLRSTAISLGVNVTSSCKEQMNMFAIAKQRRTNKIWINMHNLSYLSLNMNQNLILKRSTDRIQFAAMRKYISDNLNSIPWMFFLLAIRYHDSPPCLLSVLLKDCTRKMIPVKKKKVCPLNTNVFYWCL